MWALRHDGVIKGVYPTNNLAFQGLLKLQPASTKHALTHEGWEMIEVGGDAEALVLRVGLANWSRCDRCGSRDIEGRNIEIEDTTCSQEICCLSCELTWTEVYEATQREHYRDEEGNPWPN